MRMGTEEVDRLWSLTEDNLGCLAAEDRGWFKSLRQLMEPVIEQMNEEAAGEGGDGMPKAVSSALGGRGGAVLVVQAVATWAWLGDWAGTSLGSSSGWLAPSLVGWLAPFLAGWLAVPRS